MKKILLTLAKWFNVDLTVEKVVEVPRIEYRERTVALEGVVDGDLDVKGNLTVNGSLRVVGGVTCLNAEEE